MVKLYTFIFEFKGGTYIKQIEAKSVYKAYRKWMKCISGKEYRAIFSAKEQIHFKTLLKEGLDKPTLINGTKNVWLDCILYKRKAGFVNIVLTQSK